MTRRLNLSGESSPDMGEGMLQGSALNAAQVASMVCALSDHVIALTHEVSKANIDVLKVLGEIRDGQKQLIAQGRALKGEGEKLRLAVIDHRRKIEEQTEVMRAGL